MSLSSSRSHALRGNQSGGPAALTGRPGHPVSVFARFFRRLSAWGTRVPTLCVDIYVHLSAGGGSEWPLELRL